MMIEVCCGSFEDGMNAYYGGAKRIELNSALYLGGLSPTVSTLKLLKAKTDLKIICMVRPRGAGFCYDENEFIQMKAEAKDFLENGADGIAFGFLTNDFLVDKEKTSEFVKLIHSYHKEAVFHRAFDCTADLKNAIAELITLHVDRILTSGGEANAIAGKDTIKRLEEHFGSQIEILAGCGINADNALGFKNYTHVKQLHSSCKSYKIDATTSNGKVSYGYYHDNEMKYEVVNCDQVSKLIHNTQ